MKQKIGLAILGLRISTIIYYLIIAGFIIGGFMIPADFEEASPLELWLIAGFTLPFVILLEVVILNLKRRKYWAWIAGIIVGGLYVPSIFLPLGAMILVGLLVNGSMQEFGVLKKNSSEPSAVDENANRTAQ